MAAHCAQTCSAHVCQARRRARACARAATQLARCDDSTGWSRHNGRAAVAPPWTGQTASEPARERAPVRAAHAHITTGTCTLTYYLGTGTHYVLGTTRTMCGTCFEQSLLTNVHAMAVS